MVGIPTVGITVALDETRQANPPRALFVEGGRPGHSLASMDPEVQRRIVVDALRLLETQREPGHLESTK